MTKEEKIEQLLMLTNNEIPTDILSFYLLTAKNKILNRLYPFQIPMGVLEVPTKYEHIEINVALYLANKMGGEGEISHNENGVSRTYESSDVPESMLSEIIPKAGLL